jgi:hypothetical protein
MVAPIYLAQNASQNLNDESIVFGTESYISLSIFYGNATLIALTLLIKIMAAVPQQGFWSKLLFYATKLYNATVRSLRLSASWSVVPARAMCIYTVGVDLSVGELRMDSCIRGLLDLFHSCVQRHSKASGASIDLTLDNDMRIHVKEEKEA